MPNNGNGIELSHKTFTSLQLHSLFVTMYDLEHYGDDPYVGYDDTYVVVINFVFQV